ncbi:DNA/RNA-binding domain E.t1.c1-type [Penicillium samsonianum]|uniref:DNA/RNA-binding domain E.t1.c1-type n=1 Tax=Penicillium samsonianum TaxID=1882272 RepID=UPI00254825B4|nr:DNA/RNA-binding domain E.t1.c1-type [Penicillium samsonianum]KAJ6126065.1 DNA/RNA-binding domain E.t1.c1-type [Penicillium samsonianum]
MDSATQNSLPDPNSTSANPSPPGEMGNGKPADQNRAYSGEMIKQLVGSPVTENQLIEEVNKSYDNLVKVEKQCIQTTRQHAESKVDLSHDQWLVHISNHATLLDEHRDFLLFSQHPSANPTCKYLADKYKIPARMWRYGIHSFLELLRKKLPGSEEYMLWFINLSYTMITSLLESVPVFTETWTECLGDLARYGRVVDISDKKAREFWAVISRSWYNRAADQSSDNGRIQHHLAVLAQPDHLQEFFHYTKALICVDPFPGALDGMTRLVTPLMNMSAQERSMTTSFVATHGALFMQAPVEEFVSRTIEFLATLRKNGLEGQQGVQITSCNISAIFQYGNEDGVMKRDFKTNLTAEDRLWASSANAVDASEYTDISSQVTFRASSLAFHTLITMLGQTGDSNVSASVHISMAFIWCLTLNRAAIKRLEPLVPWSLLATYLNKQFSRDTIISKIEDESFPHLEDATFQRLPEDFLIRGQAWSRLYYPENFFDGAPTEDDRLSSEEPSAFMTRTHRVLWLGVQIATPKRWMTYDQTLGFTSTQLANELAPIAESRDHLYGNPLSSRTETSSSD